MVGKVQGLKEPSLFIYNIAPLPVCLCVCFLRT